MAPKTNHTSSSTTTCCYCGVGCGIVATKDKKANDLLMQDYKKAVLKALPHLEKAQACDPSDETLTMIQQLYRNMKDDAGLKSLKARLTTLSKNCQDLLTE